VVGRGYTDDTCNNNRLKIEDGRLACVTCANDDNVLNWCSHRPTRGANGRDASHTGDTDLFALTCMGFFRHGLALPPNYLKTLQQNSVRFLSQLKHADKDSLTALAHLGLSKAVNLGLKSAFPTVTQATEAQATFIPAIFQGKDVMLKGHTGSGKYVGFDSSCVEPPGLINTVDRLG
jgi:hypothetical protein